MTILEKKIRFSDYLLMFILMGVSGNKAFEVIFGPLLYFIVVIFELAFYNKSIERKAFTKVASWSALLMVIFIGQLITLKTIGYLACGNYIFKIACAIFAVYILKDKFAYTYFNTITTLSVIALFIWILNNIGIFIPTLLRITDQTESIIVYTQMTKAYSRLYFSIVRNCGMFWEPGAYAGYILVAFFLYINRLEYIWLHYRRKCLILIAALISTFSTTGYIIFVILVFFFMNNRIKNKIGFYIVSAIVLAGSLYLFNNLSFMGEKIQSEYETAIAMDQFDVNFSRFGAFLFDLQYIQMHPFFGNGLLNETRFSQHIAFADNLNAFGNGFSGEIAYFGIPFMLIYLISVYRNPSLKQKWRLLILIVLLLQGEYFMNYPMYFIFPFVTFFNEDMVYDFNQIKAGYNG